MSTVCFSSRGQVLIPSEIRNTLGIGKGTKALVRIENNTIILSPLPNDNVKSLFGKYKGKNLLGALAVEKAKEREE